MIGPELMTTGYHTLEAIVVPRRGKRRTVSIEFLVANRELPAFSASMISKVPGKPTDLELRAQTGATESAPILKEASFSLPKRLKVKEKTKGLEGKRVGLVQLQDRSGTKTRQTLMLAHRASQRIELSGSQGLSATLDESDSHYTLKLPDLGSYQATNIRVLLSGRRTRLLRNPRSCIKHRFTATLTSTEGQSVSLDRTLQMCKGRGR